MERGTLPDGIASRKPNVEDPTVLATLPSCIRRDCQSLYNVEDITVWMFLTMTQPEEQERTREWFWYQACLMFSDRGRFQQILQDLNIPRDARMTPYVPRRFTHHGRWTQQELAWFFNECGL